MTDHEREILYRINKYAEKELGDIDPQKVQVSMQLQKLKPIMEEIAKEEGKSLEEIFILYMDIQSEASCATQKKLEDDLQDLNTGEGMPILIRNQQVDSIVVTYNIIIIHLQDIQYKIIKSRVFLNMC